MGGVRIYDYIYSNKNPLVINKKKINYGNNDTNIRLNSINYRELHT